MVVHFLNAGGVLRRDDGITGHDVFYLTAAFMNEIVGRMSRAEKVLEPTRPYFPSCF
jgi:hypothetical protein